MLTSVSCMVIPGKGGKLIHSKKSFGANKLFFLSKCFQGIQSGVWKAIPFPQRRTPCPRLHPCAGLTSSNSCFSLNFQTSGSPVLSMWNVVLSLLHLQSFPLTTSSISLRLCSTGVLIFEILSELKPARSLTAGYFSLLYSHNIGIYFIYLYILQI